MSRGRARSPGRRGSGAGRLQWPVTVRRVEPDELHWTCDPADLIQAVEEEALLAEAEERALEEGIPDAQERERWQKRRRLSDQPALALHELIGQERAVEAIATGLGTAAPGFHVFVCGPHGHGRTALVRAALQQHLPPLPRPRDRVYVANFQHPDRPRLLTLPRGKGRRFVRDLDDMLAALQRAIPAALHHEQHVARTERLRRKTENAACRVVEDLAAELRPLGLIVGPIPEGYATPDLRLDVDNGGDPLPLRVVERKLEQGELKSTRKLTLRLKRYRHAHERLEEAGGKARSLARQGALALRRLDARAARNLAQGFTDDLARAYPTDAVRRWLDSLLEELGQRLDLFLDRDEESEEEQRQHVKFEGLGLFRANLVVDTKERPVPPVVFEPHPTYANLFGSLDTSENIPNHLRLHAGSLLQANGGVIVMEAAELFRNRDAWSALKRSVRSGWLEVQRTGAGPGGGLRPEPIRTAFKVVAIGTEEVYDGMLAYDPEFASVFKVKVQVEEEILRTPQTLHGMGRAMLRIARRCGLLPPDAGALARLLEFSARLSGRNDRLAPCFAEFLDLLQEADPIARNKRAKAIRATHVDMAMANRRRRHDLPERQAQELLDDGVVLLQSSGGRVGVVNSLVVYDDGGHTYSRPSRVTAAVGVGRQGVVDIEREACFSGDSHIKGIEIVSGLLRERFAQDKPLCLTATICFEQSYALVDGDSASTAEVLVVLSCLADLPLDQSWGITGSINQKGEIQAVGDVNSKIEGFFDSCLATGLNGRHGVIIPESNVRDLMLRKDVVKAVSKGRFHVAAIRHLDEALELLTGVSAGVRPSRGEPFPDETINARVDARLRVYAEAARMFDRP